MIVTTSANKLNSRLIKVLALVLAFAACFNFVSLAEESSTTEQTTAQAVSQEATTPESSTQEATTNEAYQELESQYAEIEKELEANKNKLDEVEQEFNEQEKVVNDIYDEISVTQKEINNLTYQVDILNKDINSTNTQIELITKQLGSLSEQIAATQAAVAQKQIQLDETYELLKQRIRAMYMAGSGSTLEFLLTSEDFATLMTRTELLIRVAEHDNNLMATLNEDIAELENLQTELETSVQTQAVKKTSLSQKTDSLAEKQTEIQTANDELEDKRQVLAGQHAQAQKELNALDKESDEYQMLIERQEDELEELSKQMQSFIKNNGSLTTDKKEEEDEEKEEDKQDNPYLDGTEKVSSKGMIFPLKASGVYISSQYGMRTHPITGEYKMHSGIDLTGGGIDGKTIYAVKDGKVIYAAKQTGYGNYIIIDHGNGISSCYAHMQDNSMKVKVGDKVLQGQPIGKVGSTGYSTGPHLHFEIRIDGATTNPTAYIPM